MGGDRSSTARARLAGRICCFCKRALPMPWTGRETYCSKCDEERKPKRKVYMHFMLRGGWSIQFLEADLKTPLPKKLTFDDPEKIYEMAKRGGASMILEDKQAIERGIATGRGSVWLSLTEEQYQKLRKPNKLASPETTS